MSEIVIKVDIPEEMQEKFEKAIGIVLKKFIDEIKWAIAQEIASKSKLSKDAAKELALEVKESVAKKHSI